MINVVLSIVFYSLFLIYSAVVIPTLTLAVAAIRIFTNHRRAMKAFRWCISIYGKGIIYGLARIFIKVNFKDCAQNKLKEPAIYIANHRAASDAFLIGTLNTELVQVVNIWPFKLPVLGVFARWSGYLSVREMEFNEFSLACKKLLDDGVTIAAFPEGTRSGNKTMGNFHGALFRVALETDTPIVPLCIMGNENKPSRGSWIMNAGQVHVHALEAITCDEYKEMSPFKLKKYVREKMQQYIDKVEDSLDV